jgi:NOL1/NOP2/sun family putative RNA methylase
VTRDAEKTSRVEQIVARYREVAGDPEAFAEALHRPLAPCIWAHPDRASPSELAASLRADGIGARPGEPGSKALWLPPDVAPGRPWQYTAGLYHVQEQASMLPAQLLAPQRHERILDLCASPGNKTAQLALALGGTGTVVANDVKPGRMAPLQSVIHRLGLVNVTTTACDGTIYPNAAGSFDRVLVDAPCSAEGTTRRTSTARDTPDDFRRWVSGVQQALLTRAVRLCRPGGTVVYSTCTFAPEENEAVVDAVLQRHPDMVRVVPVERPALATSPGLQQWDGQHFDPSLRHAFRLWPHRSGTGGFFAVALQRHGGTAPARAPAEDALPSEQSPDLHRWIAHFGLDGDMFQGLAAPTPGRYLRLLPEDHRPPPGVRRVSVGLPVLRVRVSLPKMTTAAAMAFGRTARRHLVDLEEGQLEAYWARETLELSPGQPVQCERDGFVLVRFRGHPVGLGWLRRDADSRAMLQSSFPKSWGGQRKAQSQAL